MADLALAQAKRGPKQRCAQKGLEVPKLARYLIQKPFEVAKRKRAKRCKPPNGGLKHLTEPAAPTEQTIKSFYIDNDHFYH